MKQLNQKPRSSLAEEILVTELQQQGFSGDGVRSTRDTTPPKPSPLLKEATPPADGLPAIPESPKTPKSPVCVCGGRGERERDRERGKRERKNSCVMMYITVSSTRVESIALYQDLPQSERATLTQKQLHWLENSTCSMASRKVK